MDEYTDQLDNSSIVPAVVATAAWLGVGILLDIYLITTRRRHLISDVFRTKPGKAILVAFCIHIVDKLGRFDPFRFAGARVDTRVLALIPVRVNTTLTETTRTSK